MAAPNPTADHLADAVAPDAVAPERDVRAPSAAVSDLVLLLDRDGVCLRVVAPGFCTPPRRPGEIVGRRPHDLFPAALADRFVAAVRRAADERRAVELTYALELPQGRTWCVGTASPVGDGTVLWVARDVTAGRPADAARDASAARLRAALDAALDASFLFETVRGADGRVVDFVFVEANAVAGALYGLPPEALLGRELLALFPVLRGSGLMARYVRVAETGTPYDGEYRTRDPRARAEWLWLQVVPLRGPDGGVVGLAVTARDVTARKRAEGAQRLLQEVTAALGAAPDVAGALAAALRAVCAATGMVYGESWVPAGAATAARVPGAPVTHFVAPGAPDPASLAPGTLVRGPAWHLPDDDRLAAFALAGQRFAFAPGVGLPGLAAAAGVPQWVPDLTAPEADSPRAALARRAGLRGGLAVPVVADGAVVAVLAFHARHAGDVDDAELDRLAALGTQIGAVVRRRQVEAELARERSFLAAVLDSMSEAVVVKSADGRFTLFNRATREFHNAPPVPPGGPDPWRGPRGNLYRADGVTPLPPGELPLHRALLENDHVGDVELVIAPPGGPRRTVVTNARVVRAPDGTLLGAVSAARDMTEERRLAAERERLLRALADQAEQDELTGLLNRRGFRRTAAQERRSAARTGRRDAVCYVDLDRFKPINDRYGHAAGDAALRAVADLLRATIRDADFAARLGGDEFAVYAVGINGPGEAAVLAGRLRAALAAHNRDAAAAGRPYALAFSVGVAEFAPDEPLDAGLARADSALYAAKPSRGGR